MSGYTLNVGTGTVTRDMLIALEEERDTVREQLAAMTKALGPLVEFAEATIAIDAHYAGGHPHMTTDMARQWPGVCERAQEALRLLAAASTSAETKPARVVDQSDETETNRPPERETETSTAASGARSAEENGQ